MERGGRKDKNMEWYVSWRDTTGTQHGAIVGSMRMRILVRELRAEGMTNILWTEVK